MTVLGFRPVRGGETASGDQYAKWIQCGGERSRQEHRQARHAELRMHVPDPLYNPAGSSRVDRVSQAVLSAQVPVPAAVQAASEPMQLCAPCERTTE